MKKCLFNNFSINTKTLTISKIPPITRSLEGLALLDQTFAENSFIEMYDYCDYLNSLDCTFNKVFDKLKIENERIVFLHQLKIMKKATLFDQFYGFTLTLKVKFHLDNPRFLHRYICGKLQRSISWKKVQYVIFPEFTENGVLHYHGIMWDEYEDTFIKCMNMCRREFGFVKLEKEVRDKHVWIKYIIKHRNRTGLWSLSQNVTYT